MGILTRFHHWNGTHPSYLQLFARIILGLILLIKGISFISNAENLTAMIIESRFSGIVGFLSAYITFAHLFGGVFIIIGLFTRVAVLLQIPVLIGAIFFILPEREVFNTGWELVFSIIVLVLLIFILIKGSGEISMDDYLKKHLL